MTTGRAFRPTAGRPDDGSAAAAHGDADSDAHSDAVISVERLTQVFRRRGDTDLAAVDAMTFSVGRGEAVGYIGANGAGKSTTIKMLTGILAPTSGTARTCGLDPMRGRRELARRIGVVFGQRSQLWWDLPLGESFDILAAIHRLEPRRAATRVGQLIELLDLGPTLAQPVRSLSLGQRMQAEVAAALLHEPELIILDEPTIGLDVLSRLGCGSSSSPSAVSTAPRCCSRRMTWATSSGSVTGCWSSTTAGWRSTAPCPALREPLGRNGFSSSTWTGPRTRCTAYRTPGGWGRG